MTSGGGDDPALSRVERGMMRLGWTIAKIKRQVGRVAGSQDDVGHLAHALVIDAIEQGPGEGRSEVTVGMVAERLGVDPSHASRLVAAMIKAGFVVRVASQQDGRRIGLELTDVGVCMAAHGREMRRSVFQAVMRDWTETEQAEFGRLLGRFAEGLAQVRPPKTRMTGLKRPDGQLPCAAHSVPRVTASQARVQAASPASLVPPVEVEPPFPAAMPPAVGSRHQRELPAQDQDEEAAR